MSNFNLNNAVDFARATMGNVSEVIGLFSDIGEKVTEWDIQEGAYTGGRQGARKILFHIFKKDENVDKTYGAGLSQIRDAGGRRKVKYTFPYKDGQTTNDLGRSPLAFDVDVVIHGRDYKLAWQQLLAEMNDPVPGTLTHPIFGDIRCAMETYETVHSSDKRKAMVIRVTFTEHNYVYADPEDLSRETTKEAVNKSLDFFSKAEATIAKISALANLPNAVKERLTAILESYTANFATTLAQVNATFSNSQTPDIPILIPVPDGGSRDDDGTVVNPNFPVVSDSQSSIPVDTISTASLALAVNDLTKKVNTLRAEVTSMIESFQEAMSGLGALEFYEDILNMRQSAIDIQKALELGAASSKATIIEYEVPRTMSAREIAFINGLSVDQINEIDILNPSLESLNLITKGTVVRVPVS